MKKLCLISSIFFLFSSIIFAQTAREQGVEAYKKAEYDSAVQYLTTVTKTNPTDADAWNMLGMSYLNLSKFKESHKAFEKAVKQNPQNVGFQVNMAYSSLVSNKLGNAEKEIKKALLLDPKNATAFYIRGLVYLWKGKFDDAISDADQSLSFEKNSVAVYLLKSNAYVYKFGMEISKIGKFPENIEPMQKAIESLEACLVNCGQTNLITAQNKLDELKAFNKYFASKKGQKIESYIQNAKKISTTPANQPDSTDDPTVKPLEILTKPRANYTDSARQAGVQGTITLLVLFSADGTTKNIMVLKPLSNGLTEEAIKAAHLIKFAPYTKDGKPVPIVKMLQYTFTLY